jgi:hypothetical protein
MQRNARQKALPVYDYHFWRRIAFKAKGAMTGFYYSMIVGATVAAILLFVATAIVVGIYVVLYLAAFVMIGLGMQ